MPRITHHFSRRCKHALCVWLLVATLSCTASVTAQQRQSNRRTPLVKAVASARASVVNIRGRKSVRQQNALAVSTGQSKQVNGMGTGVVIDSRGYVLTNYHVVQGVRQIKITTSKNETVIGRLIAFDEKTDLAIVKIRSSERLPVISMGSSDDILLGENVAAIGNAYGYHHSVTYGIVSALNRRVQVSENQTYNDLIQTDASINPGNSGGPLINMDGEMIGINVAVRVNAQGIAFAIPVNEVMEVAAQLMREVANQEIYSGIKARTRYAKNRPMTVVETVDPGSPAAKAGIRTGDKILSAAGKVCRRAVDFQRALLDRRPGQQLSLKIESVGRQQVVQVNLTSPALSDHNLVWKALGLKLAPVDKNLMRQLSVGFEHGLRVVQVRRNSPADRGNFSVGDILVAMDGWRTESVDNVAYVLNQEHVKKRKKFEYYLFRGKQLLFGNMQSEKIQ